MMGIFTRSYCEALNIVFLFFGAVFHGVVFRWLHQTTRVIKRKLRADDEFYDNICTRACKGFRLTIWITQACVLCFLLQTLSSEVYRVLFFALCHDCAVRKGLWFFCALSGRFGYVLMFLAHFERLRFTFKGTAMRLPQWAPKAVYGICLLFTLVFANASIFRNSQPKLASAFAFASIFLYVTGVCILTRVFFKKTIAAASNSQPDAALLEVAVRITVVATVSMLSTTLTYLLWALILRLCQMCYFWLTIGNLLVTCDMCLNSFCLLCTFATAVGPYKRVFGRLHSAILAHVSKTLHITDVKKHAVLSRVRSVTAGDKSHDVDSSDDV